MYARGCGPLKEIRSLISELRNRLFYHWKRVEHTPRQFVRIIECGRGRCTRTFHRFHIASRTYNIGDIEYKRPHFSRFLPALLSDCCHIAEGTCPPAMRHCFLYNILLSALPLFGVWYTFYVSRTVRLFKKKIMWRLWVDFKYRISHRFFFNIFN